MAITAHRYRRVEVWNRWSAAGGTRQAVIVDPTDLKAVSNVAVTDHLDLTVPLTSDAAPFVVPGAVVRVEEADGVFDEWVVLDGPNDDDGAGTRTVQAFPINAAVASCELVRRLDSDGVSALDFESVGLTPTQHITQWVLPALARGGMAWVVAGVITPTQTMNLTFSWDSPLSVLQRIAEQTHMELDIRRTGGGYAIDLVPQIGSAAPIADLRFDRNLQPGSKRARNMVDSATRVFPKGAREDNGFATMSRATWKIVSTAGAVVVLADPAGGPGPIQFDGQLSGLNGTTQAYFREPTGILTAVIGSNAAAQSVTVASAVSGSVTAGDLIQFRSDGAGSDLLWLDSPTDFALYGLKVGTVDASDVPSTNNLLKNAAMRSWPGSTSAPPPNWTKVGAGTVAQQSIAPFTRIGGFSIHRVGVADGDGLISDAVPIFPTAANRYFSGYAGLWVVSGQVRVELVFTTPGGPVIEPLLPDVASNSVIGQWEDLGASGIDAFAIGATAVALRVVQHGATVADFYIDYGQATQSSSQMPFAESSGGTQLWQAANAKLATDAAPLVSYDVPIVDLAALDPTTWGADCKVVVGGKVRITDPKLGVGIITRLIELQRDYRVPGDTRIILSNNPKDLTEMLAGSAAVARATPESTEPSAAGYQSVRARIIASTIPLTYPDSQYVTVIVTSDDPTATVQLVGVSGTAALASGAAIGVPRAQDGVSNVWVFSRGAINAGAGQAQFRGVALGKFNDDDLVSIEEQGRDTVPLLLRARVTATTPTNVTVRVAMADPFPQGAASGTITYQDLGSGGVSPASGGTVTPAATLTEAAGTFIDYTVTRPAFGAGAGRVTFTGTAANRTSDADAVDIPEVDRDTASITVRVTRISETADQIVVRVEAITPNGNATASVGYNTGGLTMTPASGGTFAATPSFTTTGHIDYTITRDTQGGTPRRVAFNVTAPGYVEGTDGVDVPPSSQGYYCTASLAGAVSIPGGSQVSLNLTESEDVGNFHDNVTNPNRFVFPVSGLYWFQGTIAFAGNGAAGTRMVWIRNQSTTVIGQVQEATGGNAWTGIASRVRRFSAGDWIELLAVNLSANAENVGTTTNLDVTFIAT
jgi:hypothetical protein